MAGRRNQRLIVNTAVGVLIFLSILVILITTAFVVLRVGQSLQKSPAESIVIVESAEPAVPTLNVQDVLLESPDYQAPEPSTEEDSKRAVATRNPIRPKPIIESNRVQQPFWTPTPLPTATPSPTPTPYPTFVSQQSSYTLQRPPGLALNERWIDVDLTNQKLVAYEGHNPVFDSLVSSGLPRYPTVTGQFRIWLRFKAQDMNGRRLGYDYYLKDVPFVQYFYQDYALHGTYWHSNFGHPMSHGCVNLPNPAAEWLFNWAEHGTVVNIHY